MIINGCTFCLLLLWLFDELPVLPTSTLNIMDWISAQTRMDVFEKLTFQVQKENKYFVAGFVYVDSIAGRNQPRAERTCFRQRLN